MALVPHLRRPLISHLQIIVTVNHFKYMQSEQIELPHGSLKTDMNENIFEPLSTVFSELQTYFTPRMLEIGSTENSSADFLIMKKIQIHLSNPDLKVCERLAYKYKGNEFIRRIHHIDFSEPNFSQLYSEHY